VEDAINGGGRDGAGRTRTRVDGVVAKEHFVVEVLRQTDRTGSRGTGACRCNQRNGDS
jgi:hypothetical protein